MSMENPIEWLERQERFRRIHDGRELTPERLGNDFLRMGPVDRANVLNDLDTKLAAAELTLNESVKLNRFRGALIRADRAARRVQR